MDESEEPTDEPTEESAAVEVEPAVAESIFAGVRSVSWSMLLLTTVIAVAALSFSNVYVLQNPIPPFAILLERATSGLINGSLIASLSTLVITAIVMFGVAGVRPRDVGWRGRQLRQAIAVTIAFWVVMQVVIAVITGLTDPLVPHELWNRRRLGSIGGDMLAQFLGTALLEETLMRGFIMTQLYLKAATLMRHRAALALAVVVSTLLFAAFHLPNQLWVSNMRGPELVLGQLIIVVFGVLACALFLAARNLFVVVGLHAIINAPTPLVAADNATILFVWLGLTLLLLLVCWWLNRGAVAKQRDPASG